MTFTPRECADELAHELMMRGRVYTRQVEAGKMSEDTARRRKAIIKQMLDRYELEAQKDQTADDPIEELDLFGD